MSTSWRIETKLVDRTDITPTSDTIIGATVIKAPKGKRTFTFFNKGDTSGIINVFGYPSKEYPSIQDALDIINKCSMWIASPYKNGKYGGVFVTKKGTVPFVNGVTSKEAPSDLSKVECDVTVGITDGTPTVESEIADSARVDLTTFKLYVNDTNLEVTLTQVEGTSVYTITDANSVLAEGSQLDISTNEIALNFTVAPIEGTIVKAEYTMDVSDTLFILFNSDMQSDDLAVKVVADDDVEGNFNIYVSRYNPINDEWEELSNSPYNVGLSETSKDTYGDNVYINNIFNEDSVLFTPLVINSVVDSFESDTKQVELHGGYRGDEVDGADIATTYDYLKDTSKYQIKFAFDATASSEVVTKFESLRNNECKWTRFLYCATNETASEIIANPSSASGGITTNRGMYCYVLNYGIHKDVYQGNDFLCTNMGLISGRLVDVLRAGGGNPAWIDEDGVGGILGSSITKLSQSASETELEQLDTLGFNPVVYDATYGAMIVGWRTRQVKKTAYSYIAQSSLADTIVDSIEKNVLPNRIAKAIDETAYSAVRTGCNTILRNSSRWLEDFTTICDSRNNNDDTRADQKLYVSVGVVFKGFAEKILFTFSAYRQGVDVEEEILKG